MIQLTLILGYISLSYVSVLQGGAGYASAAMIFLALMLLLKPLRRRRKWAVALILAIGAGVTTPLASHLAPVAIFLPPVIINVWLAWLFGHTLTSGNIPLVERLVRILHANQEIPDPTVWHYARRVTGCWTGLFIFNALLCAVLALFGRPHGLLDLYGQSFALSVPIVWWAYFSDIGCHLLVGAFFLGEYTYRRRRFPWQPYGNIIEFLRHAARVGPLLIDDIFRAKLPRSSNQGG
jgi:uncharacterized membrane protein